MASLAGLARILNLTFGPTGPKRTGLPRCLAMTDPDRTPDLTRLVDALPEGAGIIFRHYGASGRAHIARDLVRHAHQRAQVVLIADDLALARWAGADGVHMPSFRLPRLTEASLRCRPGWLVTAAAHSRLDLMHAARTGVDAALLSPVFPTRSHPGATALGVPRFAALVRQAGCPVYAMGGVGGNGLRRLKHSGAAGVAGIDLFT